jgi:hypothetical protein
MHIGYHCRAVISSAGIVSLYSCRSTALEQVRTVICSWEKKLLCRKGMGKKGRD